MTSHSRRASPPSGAMLCSEKFPPVPSVNNPSRLRLPLLCLMLWLVGCASVPSDSNSTTSSAVPAEGGDADCLCHAEGSTDELDLAVEALLNGDITRARALLVAYGEIDQPAAESQAQVLMSLLDLLEAEGYSPAEHGYRGADNRVALARLMLSLVARLQAEADQLVAENEALKADLEKREEAIKRLRELTLGQPEA